MAGKVRRHEERKYPEIKLSTVLLIAPVFVGFTFAVIARRYVHFGPIFTDRAQQGWWADIIPAIRFLNFGRGNEGNIDREADDKENSEQDVNRSNDSSSTMSENPVSFVVGDPDNDRSEELEIEDSFPSESYDITTTQVQQNAMAGLIERRKRLR